jgi:hypothetical protein
VRKPSRNLPVASKTSALAAEKTGQVLVRTGPHPGRTESPVISGKEVGYVRRSEFTAMVCSKSLILRKLGGDTVADTAPKQESRPEGRPSEKPHKRLVWLRGPATISNCCFRQSLSLTASQKKTLRLFDLPGATGTA